MEKAIAPDQHLRFVQAVRQGAVVCVADPEDFADERVCNRMRACLDDDELSRMSRFRFDVDRQLFLVAHGLLRAALGYTLGCRAAELRFTVTERGRPELSDHDQTPQLRFNISHTHGLVACAIAEDRMVGVDVEHVDRRVDIPNLSRTVLSEAELMDLQGHGGEALRHRFFELWTLKEAHIKALGHGLGLPLRDISFQLPGPPPATTAVMHGTHPSVTPKSPFVYSCWRLGKTHQLALALQQPATSELSFLQITPDHPLMRALDS